MKVIEARLSALTNTQSAALKLRQVSLPAVESQLPSQLGYSLLARRADLQAAHWYIESSLSSIDAAKAAFYPDINLMAFYSRMRYILAICSAIPHSNMALPAG